MEEKEFKRSQNRNLLVVGIICLVAIIGIVSYTYSFFQVRDTNTGSITGTVASTSLEVEVEKLVPSTNVGLVPQLDEYITSAVVGRNNKNCVDDNGNEVCQVYAITVTNTSSVSVNVDGLVELNANNNPNLKWAEITGYTLNMTTNPALASNHNLHTSKNLTINEEYAKNQEKTYYIVVWISETGDAQEDTGIFTGTVTFKLHEDPPALVTLTNLGLTSSLKTDIPNFAKASYSTCDTNTDTTCENTVGIYEAEDDLGTSYYFRGDVENNYVKFGKWSEDTANQYYGHFSETQTWYMGFSTLEECQNSSYNYNCSLVSRAGKDMYWRIIRINGDGTIRMIYDGINPHPNGEVSADKQLVDKSLFNDLSSWDNTFVGYMTGVTGSSDYGTTHSNATDSGIKLYLEDTWYANEFNDTEFEQYITDAIYCNDRETTTVNSNFTGDGSGTTDTLYKAYERLENVDTPTPVLTCSQANDRFTLESNNFSIETNGKLDEPVGLITADEVVLAGGNYIYGVDNYKYYLYDGNWYWTMTPESRTSSSGVYVYHVFTPGGFHTSTDQVNASSGVRPVITLKADALMYDAETSNGSKNHPFVINNNEE